MFFGQADRAIEQLALQVICPVCSSLDIPVFASVMPKSPSGRVD